MQQAWPFVAVTVSLVPPDDAWSTTVIAAVKAEGGALDVLPGNYDQLNWRAPKPDSGSYTIGMPATIWGARGDGTIENITNTFDPLGVDIFVDSGGTGGILRPLAQAPPGIRALWLEAPSIVGTPEFEVEAVNFKAAP